MWQATVVVRLLERQLLAQPLLALAQRAAPSPDRGDMLADGQGDALHKCRVDVPTQGSQDVLDGLQGAKHHAVAHADQTPAPHRLHHLRIEQPRQWQPARLGCWALRLPAWWLPPVPIVGQHGRQILPKPVGEKQRGTVGRSDLRHGVDHALRHRARTSPDVEGKPPCALGVHRGPDPLG